MQLNEFYGIFFHMHPIANQNLFMRKNPSIKTVLSLVIIVIITYALAEGIRYGSKLGVVFALLSMACLFIVFKLNNRLNRLKQREEEENAS
jgi:drug/metabolite transporter (DMT)-like permease